MTDQVKLVTLAVLGHCAAVGLKWREIQKFRLKLLHLSTFGETLVSQ